jgi:hypothetical protein
MSTPTPQLKSNDLIDRLNAVPYGEGREFILRKLSIEAKALVKVDPAAGYMILGMISSDLGNVESCRDYFKSAMGNSSDLLIRRNYASALMKMGFTKEASDLAIANAKASAKQASGNIEVLFEAASSCVQAGRIEQAYEFSQQLKGMGVHQDLVDQVESILKLPATTLENLPFISEAVSQVLRQYNVTLTRRALQIIDEGSLVMRYFISPEANKVADINMDIAEVLADADPEAGRHLTVLCVPY